MEEYKKIYSDIFVPSLSMFLATAGATVSAYGLRLSITTEIAAGCAIMLLCILSFIPVYRNSLKEPDTSINAVKSNRTRAILFLLLTAIAAAAAAAEVVRLTDRPLGITQLPKKFTAETVTERRYDRVIYAAAEVHGRAINLIAYAQPDADIQEGDTITISSPLKKLEAKDDNGSAYSRSLLRRGISYRVYLNKSNWHVADRKDTGLFHTMRKKFENHIDSLFNPETASLIKALYFGSDHYIDRRTVLEFKRAGVLHILAASGFNVGILAVIPLALLGLFRINRKAITAMTIAALFCYLLMTDMPVSLVRAVFMAAIYSVFFIFDFNRSLCNILFLSGTALLLLLPYEIYGLGFQLSFSATLGILLFFRFYKKSLSKLPSPLRNSLALTFSAQLPVIPIIAVQLGELNMAGFLSNCIIIPLTSGIMYFSISANLLGLLPFQAAGLFTRITEMLTMVSFSSIHAIASMNLHYVSQWPDMRLILPLLFLAAPLLVTVKKRHFAVAALAAGIALPILLFSGQKHEGVSIFEKGDNLALLVNEKEGIYLIGSLNDTGLAMEIVKELHKLAPGELTILLPDPDYKNIAAFSYIARNTPVAKCVIDKKFRFNLQLKRFFSLLDRDRVKIEIASIHPGADTFFQKDGSFALDSQDRIVDIYFKIKSAGYTAQSKL